MQGNMPEHYEYRILSILRMIGSSLPVRVRQQLEPFHELPPVLRKSLERFVQMHLEKEIIGVMVTGKVRANYRGRLAQHSVEPFEEQSVHVRKVARVFMNRPPLR